MTKEYLEAFNRIALHTEYDNDSPYDYLCFDYDCNLVDEALQRLEAIDKLQEEIGCPLEIFIKLHNRVHIYDVKGKPFKILQVLSDTIVVRKLQEEKIFLLLKDYKKTWWLKEDKSE